MQLSARCELELDALNEFVENNIIVADGPRANLYSTSQLTRLRKACRLQKDRKLDAPAVAYALVLLDRIETLEKRVSWLQLLSLDDQNRTKH